MRDKLEQRLAAQDAADNNQPGPKNRAVLPASNADPLGDPDDSYDEDIKIAMEAIEMEEFKEECELGEYVVLESNGNTDPLYPISKRARLDDNAVPSTSSTTKQPIVVARNIMPSTQTIGRIGTTTVVVRNTPAGMNATKPQATTTPTGSLTKPSQQVRVVPTERLRNTATAQVKPIGIQSDKPIIVKYAPVGSGTGSTVIQVKHPANNMLPPAAKKLGPNQTPIRVVPLNALNDGQRNITQSPGPNVKVSQIGTMPQVDPLATGLARSAPTPDPLATEMARSAPTPDPLAMKPGVVQINNSMLSDVDRSAPTPDPLAMCPTYTEVGLSDMGNNPSMIPVVNSLATLTAKPAIVLQTSTTGSMAPWLPVVPEDPLATTVQQASVAKLLNTSTITVTRIDKNTQPAMDGDPLATYSGTPSTARSNSTTPTITKTVPAKPQSTAKAGTSGSPSVPGVVLLKNANLTVTKIPQQNGTPGPSAKPVPPKPVNQPTVRVVRQAPPAKAPPTANPRPRKNCDCRVEIAKRLRLLDQRTRQMESYMNDLIDLIQPENEFDLEPIKTLDELERFNYDLGSSPQHLQKVKSWLDRRINGNDSHWRMLDAVNLIFDCDFLLQCSWKYSSKIPLNSYTYVVELFKHAGSTPYNKVTMICVGNFLMGHIKNLHKKKAHAEKKKNEGTAASKEASSSNKGASNKEGATNQKDAADQEDATNQEDAPSQENATNQEEASNKEGANNLSEAINQDDATHPEDQAAGGSNATQMYVEQEIADHENVEYLDEDDADFNLESTDYLNDDTLSSEF
ncbi:AGAP005474-PA-like protein [Anopheles sinensis]|uniref:AGAP005474-PA-like protein n=1 Tax=Anopheles sinensis TaxID=74873 RepID=A0A084VWN5_ANOSI|nr:AGAP005474-PA-like protein [Anopheles sinensis]